MMELYDYFRSSACYRVRIVLNYKEIPFHKHEVHLVNNGGEQHGLDYKQVNHQELIPALRIDDTKILTQSLSIIEYLEEQYPTPGILPTDLYMRAEARRLAYIIACDVHPVNNLRVTEYLKFNLAMNDSSKLTWYHHWMGLGFASFENYISSYRNKGNFSLGEFFSLADVCLIPQVYNALRFELPMDVYPRIMEIYNYCLKLPFIDQSKP